MPKMSLQILVYRKPVCAPLLSKSWLRAWGGGGGAEREKERERERERELERRCDANYIKKFQRMGLH